MRKHIWIVEKCTLQPFRVNKKIAIFSYSFNIQNFNSKRSKIENKVLREKLVQNVNELEVQQRDPNSPLYSVKSFEELDLRHDLLKGILSKISRFLERIRKEHIQSFCSLDNELQIDSISSIGICSKNWDIFKNLNFNPN